MKKQIANLARKNYRFLSAEDLFNYLSGRLNLSRKCILLTFDDGYLHNYTHALPILRKYSARATFYVSTRYLDSGKPFPFLTKGTDTRDDSLLPLGAEQVKDMRSSGMEIASHSHDHVDYMNLDESEMSEQIRSSQSGLEAIIGPAFKSFVVPYGLWGPPAGQLKKILEKQAFQGAFLGQWGTAKIGCDRFDLPRIPIYGTDGPVSFFLKTRGASDWVGTLHKVWHRYRTGSLFKERYGKPVECN